MKIEPQSDYSWPLEHRKRIKMAPGFYKTAVTYIFLWNWLFTRLGTTNIWNCMTGFTYQFIDGGNEIEKWIYFFFAFSICGCSVLQSVILRSAHIIYTENDCSRLNRENCITKSILIYCNVSFRINLALRWMNKSRCSFMQYWSFNGLLYISCMKRWAGLCVWTKTNVTLWNKKCKQICNHDLWCEK